MNSCQEPKTTRVNKEFPSLPFFIAINIKLQTETPQLCKNYNIHMYAEVAEGPKSWGPLLIDCLFLFLFSIYAKSGGPCPSGPLLPAPPYVLHGRVTTNARSKAHSIREIWRE